MFAEALAALAAFAQEATDGPVRVGRGGAAATIARPSGRGAAADGAEAPAGPRSDTDRSADEPGVTLHLVSVARTERFQAASREVARDPSGTGLQMRQGPGWFDLTVAIEAGGEEPAAAEVIERLLAAGIRVGDLAKTLDLASEYPVYALIDTPSEEELRAWWEYGLVRVPRAALKAVMTMAVQPFELAPVGYVRSRRLDTDDLRTRVRETVER